MRRTTLTGALAKVAALVALIGLQPKGASADEVDLVAKRERCNVRLAIALTGNGPTAAQLAAADPMSQLDGLLASAPFRDRYAGFINASFNESQGPSALADAPYWVALHVLQKGLPWKQLFVGPFGLAQDAQGKVTVTDAPTGLGYFHVDAWMQKHAGNEGEGIRLRTAARIISNSVGMKVKAVQALPNQDTSAKGREAAACRGCHFDSWFALDKVASVLPRRVVVAGDIKFGEPPARSAVVLDGVTVKDDREIVNALVSSEQFLVEQCRLAFTFLYGRPENSCEGAALDQCIDALSTNGTITAGLAAIAREPAFCE